MCNVANQKNERQQLIKSSAPTGISCRAFLPHCSSNPENSVTKAKTPQKGIEKGRAEGLQLGEQRGIEKGRSEGERQATLKIARTMLQNGIDRNTVMKMTGLTEDDLAQIQH